MKDKLLIIGASGHGKVVADIAIEMNKWEYIAFIDDNRSLKKSLGLDIIGSTSDLLKYIDEYDFFVGIGDNYIRERLQEKLTNLGATIPKLIHPTTVIGRDVYIGEGTVVMPGAIINCSTKIGKGCIINTSATIDHDNLIEDYVHISPGVNLAGTVKVGKSTWIGIGSVIIHNISICERCTIGGGSVVIRDIISSGIYLGVPANEIN